MMRTLVLSLVLITLSLIGCTSLDKGSRIVVGEETILPELVSDKSTLSLRIFESVKGATVMTAEDALLRVSYSNTCKNTYLGIVSVDDTMALSLTLEPNIKKEDEEK